ncbi:MAG: HD domain protein, partial [Blautia sp.]|nr:HD domain protein [Blautia sp.]
MEKWKTYHVSLFVIFCVGCNLFGRLLALRFNLPLWLDTYGTVLASYVLGPVCGGIIGLTGNLIYGFMNGSSGIYALTSLFLGILIGYGAKHGAFDHVFPFMVTTTTSVMVCVVISLSLNLLFYNGSTGNLYGDGVAHYFSQMGVPHIVCCFLGQLYIDFSDKLVTMLSMVGMVRVVRYIRRHLPRKKAPQGLLALCLFFLALLIASPAKANNYVNYVQIIYSNNNGLPCGEANDIAMTEDGILWVGTYAGLYRYNGSSFQYMDLESVRNVNALYLDAEGRLWIGTNDSGLSLCIHEKIVNTLDTEDGLPSNAIKDISQSNDGYYYVGTTGAMQVLSLHSGLQSVAILEDIVYADSLSAGPDGLMAAVTNQGTLFLLKGAEILLRLENDDDTQPFNSCCFTPEGTLLVGTSGNLVFTYETDGTSLTRIDTFTCENLSSINSFTYLEDGTLFICADNGVGYRNEEGNFSQVNTGSFNSSIDNMIQDYQGSLWFTSSRLGLLHLAPSSFVDIYSSMSMERQVVNAVIKWQGDYYFGTDTGLDVVDGNLQKQLYPDLSQKLKGTRVRNLYTDSKGHLWICTYGRGIWEVTADGLVTIYDSSSGTFGGRARMVLELSDGTMVVGGDTGLCFIKDQKVLETLRAEDGLRNPMILTMTELSDGRVLVGTDGGGLIILKDLKVEKTIQRSRGNTRAAGSAEEVIDEAMTSGVILRSMKDPLGDGVFLVMSNSLCYLGEDDTVRTLDNFVYFNNYNIWYDPKDPDTFFIMSSAGIYVVSRSDLLSGRPIEEYELLDARQGLGSSLTPNSWCYAEEDGHLFVPCDSGVFLIDTKSYSTGIPSCRMSI